MSDLDLGFSMRMDDDAAVPAAPVDMFAVRPDTKGPKTVAVLMFLGAMLVLWAWLCVSVGSSLLFSPSSSFLGLLFL